MLSSIRALSVTQNPSVFLYGPGEAKIESQAMPNVEDPYDVIIRINYVGVCGSDVCGTLISTTFVFKF